MLRKSYSVLQDDFFAAMRKAGYDDVERGERGSSEEHLTVTQFKVQQEQARLAELTEQNRQREQQAAALGKQIERIQNQHVDVAAIEKIEAKSITFSTKAVRGSRGGIMHNKYCIIDNQVVITGSYNWSKNAEDKNEENAAVMYDYDRASDYSVEFRKMFDSE